MTNLIFFKARHCELIVGNLSGREKKNVVHAHGVAHNVQRNIWNVGCASTPSQQQDVWLHQVCSNPNGNPSISPWWLHLCTFQKHGKTYCWVTNKTVNLSRHELHQLSTHVYWDVYWYMSCTNCFSALQICWIVFLIYLFKFDSNNL